VITARTNISKNITQECRGASDVSSRGPRARAAALWRRVRGRGGGVGLVEVGGGEVEEKGEDFLPILLKTPTKVTAGQTQERLDKQQCGCCCVAPTEASFERHGASKYPATQRRENPSKGNPKV